MLPLSASNHQFDSSSQTKLDLFLVCGLGSLGQHCVAVLKEYGVTVSALDLEEPKSWEIQDLPNLLENLLIGDCCQPSVLEQAKIRQCRTVLLVTNDERVNTEAAFAARLLHPGIRLVVRSNKKNLNELLRQNLGNFIAFEPNQLSASGFAFAALGDETIAYINLEEQLLRVVKHQIQPGEHWCNRWLARELSTSFRRILSHAAASSSLPKQFHQLETEATLHSGDTIVYIEIVDQLAFGCEQPAIESKQNLQQLWQEIVLGITGKNLKQKIVQFWAWIYQSRTRRVATICGITVLILWFCGIVLYSLNYPGINTAEAFYTIGVLLLGGYGDVFGGVEFATQSETAEHMPGWLRLFSLGLTLTGTAFVGVLYALLTDNLLTARFQFFTSRPPTPQQDHVVLIGLNQMGQQVAALLQEFNHLLVGITSTTLDPGILPQMPMVVGNTTEVLNKVNIERAKSVVVVTDEDMENLEIGLMAHTLNPTSSLILRTDDQHFSDYVAQLFPYAQVLCTSAVSAEVFAAAAFGENILSLFHFGNQTILVVEYMVEAGDTLNGLLLSEFAYGYGVVPILFHKSALSSPKFMPSDDIRLEIGARLIVLATSHSLQQIEWGNLAPRTWQVQIEKALTQDAIFEGANKIALISGCSISTARELMNNLPGLLPLPLYKHQAQRLVRQLSKVRVLASLLPITPLSSL